jgi:hypothetical protein
MALNEKQQRIRQKLARGESLDPAEELEWMDAQDEENGGSDSIQVGHADEPERVREIDDDEEDTEHHDVGLRRNAINILMIERGEMFGTAIPLHQDMQQTLKEIQIAVQEIYIAKRANAQKRP